MHTQAVGAFKYLKSISTLQEQSHEQADTKELIRIKEAPLLPEQNTLIVSDYQGVLPPALTAAIKMPKVSRLYF